MKKLISLLLCAAILTAIFLPTTFAEYEAVTTAETTGESSLTAQTTPQPAHTGSTTPTQGSTADIGNTNQGTNNTDTSASAGTTTEATSGTTGDTNSGTINPTNPDNQNSDNTRQESTENQTPGNVSTNGETKKDKTEGTAVGNTAENGTSGESTVKDNNTEGNTNGENTSQAGSNANTTNGQIYNYGYYGNNGKNNEKIEDIKEPSETENNLRTLQNGIVTVVGNIPEEYELWVSDENQTMQLFSMRTEGEDTEEENPILARLDISVVDGEWNEWQPAEGEKVTVTLDTQELGLDDDTWYEITHIHINPETGGEIITQFPAYAEKCKLTFELDGFSVIVIKTIYSNVELSSTSTVFYYAYPSNNEGNYKTWDVVGFYIEENGDVHALLGSDTKNSDKLELKSGILSNNDCQISLIKKEDNVIDYFEIKDNKTNTTVAKVKGNARSLLEIFGFSVGYKAYADYNLGKIVIDSNNTEYEIAGTFDGKDFTLKGKVVLPTVEVKAASGETYNPSDFNSNIITVSDYNEAEGNWVTFQVKLTNELDVRITLDSIIDTMSISDIDTIQVYDGISKKWVDTNTSGLEINVNEALSSSPKSYLNKGSNTYYIAAHIKPRMDFYSGEKIITDTATVSPANATSISASATVTITPPPRYELIINVYGLDEGQTSVYRVAGPTGFNIDMRVMLKGNGCKTITNLPAGEYTVTPENGWTWRYSKPDPEIITVKAGETKQLIFNYTKPNGKFLSGISYIKNNFSGIIPQN